MTFKDAIIERGSLRHLKQSLTLLRDTAKEIDMILSGDVEIDSETRRLIRSATEWMNLIDREFNETHP